MKIGDLVRPTHASKSYVPEYQTSLVEHDWRGIIIDWDEGDPVVFWNMDFPHEIEYACQLEVVSESR